MGSRIHREMYVRFRGEAMETCLGDKARRCGLSLHYTLAAKKMAYIFFGVECAMKPSNKGITILVAASNEEVEEQLNELFK